MPDRASEGVLRSRRGRMRCRGGVVSCRERNNSCAISIQISRMALQISVRAIRSSILTFQSSIFSIQRITPLPRWGGERRGGCQALYSPGLMFGCTRRHGLGSAAPPRPFRSAIPVAGVAACNAAVAMTALSIESRVRAIGACRETIRMIAPSRIVALLRWGRCHRMA